MAHLENHHDAVSVDEHAALIRELVAGVLEPLPEKVPLGEALGRVLTEAVTSRVDLPLFRNAQMDGFAVRASDIGNPPQELEIVGESAARPAEVQSLAPGQAIRIMTGAVVPAGADAVVPVEETTVDGDVVTVLRSRGDGDYVRERGSDLLAGTVIVPAGTRLASRHLAALAAAGEATLIVRHRIRIALITTGAELIPVGQEPLLGQIFDSNAVALRAAVEACGAVAVSQQRVSDDTEAMRSALEFAAESADLIVTSGGISAGDYEVVRQVLEPLGARVGHVAMQPGGPQATAVFRGVPVLCFPGNPVSTQLSFEVFLAPLLREAAGLPPAITRSATITRAVRSVPGKRQYLRGRLLAGDRVEPVSGPGSHLVAAMASSDVLIDVPSDTTELAENDTVEVILL